MILPLVSVLETMSVGDRVDSRLTTTTAVTLGFLEPKQFKELGAKRVKISYGPFLVPAASDETTHGMKEFELGNIEMPCNDCLITSWQPDLTYEDGSTANADKGMWLHHAVYLNMNRTDVPCARFEDRFAASGNERTVVDVTVGGYVHPVRIPGRSRPSFLEVGADAPRRIAPIKLVITWERPISSPL